MLTTKGHSLLPDVDLALLNVMWLTYESQMTCRQGHELRNAVSGCMMPTWHFD